MNRFADDTIFVSLKKEYLETCLNNGYYNLENIWVQVNRRKINQLLAAKN